MVRDPPDKEGAGNFGPVCHKELELPLLSSCMTGMKTASPSRRS